VLVQGPPELQAYLDSPGGVETKAQVRRTIRVLRENPAAGEHVRRDLWPDRYARLRINNLFRCRVGGQTRIAYTIVDTDPDTRVVRILDLFRTHKEYERVFGYG